MNARRFAARWPHLSPKQPHVVVLYTMDSSTRRPPTAGDSFSGLVSFGRNKPHPGNLSLLEQQKLREAQKAKEEEERRKKMDALFGDSNARFWSSLETPAPATKEGAGRRKQKVVEEDEDDILAAFNSSAPVDNSSHFPPPRGGTLGLAVSADPFDLENLPSRDPSPFKPTTTTTTTRNVLDDDDADDILGDLARPVEELPKKAVAANEVRIKEEEKKIADPRDGAIAELVEMGFSVSQAKKALAETDTGLDVEAAVGWLLEDAHRKSSARLPPAGLDEDRSGSGDRASSSSRRFPASSQPQTRARDAQGEKDIGQFASEIGGTLFKSANNLWTTSKKKVGKAIAELQDGGTTGDGGLDPGMPKWMRDQKMYQAGTPPEPSHAKEKGDRDKFAAEDMRPPRPTPNTSEPALTEEALMLEAGSGPPRRGRPGREKPSSSSYPQPLSEREQIQRQRQQAFEAAIRDKERELRERERPRHAAAIPNSIDRKTKLTRGAVEEESAVQYVSRNRRRPPPSTTSSIASNSKPATPEPPQGDLLFGGGNANSSREQSRNPFLQLQQNQHQHQHQQHQQHQQQQRQATPPISRRPTPAAAPPIVRRPAVSRPVIAISPSALQDSSVSRQKGSEAFKRGDYPIALTHYSSALNPLPSQHPLRIIVLCNRALCNLKIGDSKSALRDCDEALAIVGPTNGEGEKITLQDGSQKDMKEFFAKALSRKAEGLEHLERWPDALRTWTQAVEAGAGGAIAISGKRRCENALKPKAPPPPARPAVRPKTAATSEAARVTALRRANAAADRVEEEKLALHDSVDERINAWKTGKEGNLRALLASLDTVLWEGNGWKKVGMGELLMPNKCKIAYMKGIAKVHPDKVCFPLFLSFFFFSFFFFFFLFFYSSAS